MSSYLFSNSFWSQPIDRLATSIQLEPTGTHSYVNFTVTKYTYRINWSDDDQEILNLLVDYVTSLLEMAFPDFSKLFVLHTDAPWGPGRRFEPD